MLSEVYTSIKGKSTALVKVLIVILASISILVTSMKIEVDVTDKRVRVKLETSH